MTKLDPVFKEKLLTALKSGDYIRGEGQLRRRGHMASNNKDGHEYCCLGVANDILLKEAGKTWVEYEGNEWYLFEGRGKGDISPHIEALGLTDEVQRKLGFINDSSDQEDGFGPVIDYIQTEL